MTVYGTRIESDIDLPYDFGHDTETRYTVALRSMASADFDDTVTCGFPLYWAHGRRVYLYSDRLFDGSEEGQPWQYEVKDVVSFFWSGGERTIRYELHGNGTPQLLAFWFVHLLLPLYMTLEEMYDFFHAGAVEVEGRPILFIAPSMGGKSTMTDHFIRQGHPLVSDDKVPTFVRDGKFMAVGSHPYHRPYRKFENLGYRVDAFTEHFKPIHAFYALEGADADADILITEIKGFAKFDTLLPNYLYMFSWLKPRRLKYLSQMLNSIRVFRVQVPWDKERLDEVHDLICRHSGELE